METFAKLASVFHTSASVKKLGHFNIFKYYLNEFNQLKWIQLNWIYFSFNFRWNYNWKFQHFSNSVFQYVQILFEWIQSISIELVEIAIGRFSGNELDLISIELIIWSKFQWIEFDSNWLNAALPVLQCSQTISNHLIQLELMDWIDSLQRCQCCSVAKSFDNILVKLN